MSKNRSELEWVKNREHWQAQGSTTTTKRKNLKSVCFNDLCLLLYTTQSTNMFANLFQTAFCSLETQWAPCNRTTWSCWALFGMVWNFAVWIAHETCSDRDIMWMYTCVWRFSCFLQWLCLSAVVNRAYRDTSAWPPFKIPNSRFKADRSCLLSCLAVRASFKTHTLTNQQLFTTFIYFFFKLLESKLKNRMFFSFFVKS